MAVDMFLKLEPIKGESQDKAHKDEMDILAWSWGMSQSGTTHMGKGSGSGKANFQDLSVTKYVDSASTDLMKFCTMGSHIEAYNIQYVPQTETGAPDTATTWQWDIAQNTEAFDETPHTPAGPQK